MNKLNLFIRSVKYSIGLTFQANRIFIFVYVILSLANRMMPILNMYVFQNIIDTIAASPINFQRLFACVGIFVGIILLSQVFSTAFSIINDHIIEKTSNKYLIRFLEKMQKIPLAVADTSSGRDIIEQARYCGWDISDFFFNLCDIVVELYTFFFAFIMIARFNVWLSLLLLCLCVPGIVMDAVFDRKSEAFRREHAPDRRKFSYYRWMLTDRCSAKDVRMYDLTAPLQKKYEEEKNEYREKNKKLDQKKRNVSLLTELMKQTGELSFILFTVICAVRGEITIGHISLYIGLIYTIVNSFRNSTNTVAWTITRCTDNMAPVFEFYDIPCLEDKAKKRNCEDFQSLEFENVYFTYPSSDTSVLKGASFTLKKGEKLSIVGINGAGKSTIIKLMIGLYAPDSGRILLNGYPLEDYNIADVRRLFSILFQNHISYPLTLRENVALSDYERRSDDDEIIKALTKSGVYEELEDKLTAGLDTYMTRQFDDDGVELSGGQWQKLALARAYFKKAQIIIFDEPSASLDAEAEDRIFRDYMALAEGETSIMISHRISSARMSTKIIALDGGKIIETGTHEQLVAQDGFYAKLYNLQKRKYTNEGVSI